MAGRDSEKVGWFGGSVPVVTAYSFCSFSSHCLATACCVIGAVLGPGHTQMWETLLSALGDETCCEGRVSRLRKGPQQGIG